MKLFCIAGSWMIVSACSQQPEQKVVHDMVVVHDTVRTATKEIDLRGAWNDPHNPTFLRCLDAAHRMADSSDERTGTPSQTKLLKREQQMRMLCRISPKDFLPDLR
jgi:hypothetical protein